MDASRRPGDLATAVQDTRNPVFVLFRFRNVGAVPKGPSAPAAKAAVAVPTLKPCLYKKRASASEASYDDLAQL